MKPDDALCLCFHVSVRKVVNFIRLEKPTHASQLAECFGAGTGCGWCRKYLCQLFEQVAHPNEGSPGGRQLDDILPESEAYRAQRSDYIRQGRGTPPPGATPMDPAK